MKPTMGTMHVHRDGELTFERPASWADRSSVVYSAPPDPASPTSAPPNVVVTRHAIDDGETLQTYTLRETMRLAKALRGFELVESSAAELGGVPAMVVRFTWQSPLGPLEQSFTVLESPRAHGRRILVAFLTTVRKSEAARARPFFDAILRSVRFEATPASAPPSIRPIPMPRWGG